MGRKSWRKELNRSVSRLESDLIQWLKQFKENPERIEVVNQLGDLIESRLGRKPPLSIVLPEEILIEGQSIFEQTQAISAKLTDDQTAQLELSEALLLQVLVWCRYQAASHTANQVGRTFGFSNAAKAALIVGGIMSGLVIAKKLSKLFNDQETSEG